ncbi:MAG TPA: hypothetical protein VIF32_07205 [Gemmatimonadaceae bacterium]
MKAYLGTTGTVFALVTVAHLARTAEVWGRVGSDPWFVAGYALITLVAAALAVWAWRLYRRLTRPSSNVAA